MNYKSLHLKDKLVQCSFLHHYFRDYILTAFCQVNFYISTNKMLMLHIEGRERKMSKCK